MNFKVKKIRQKSPHWLDWTLVKKGLKFGVFAIAFLLVAWGMVTGAKQLYQIGLGGSKGGIISKVVGLKTDSFGHTNFLVLGVAGQQEEGGNLSDSIMLVSIQESPASVSLLSLPRDLYIDSAIGARKINEIYAAARYKHGDRAGLEIVQEAVGNFADIQVHYGAVVDFALFEKVIDSLGGVKIFVPEDINDPFYPAANYGYQTFTLRKGIQTLDGDTALKYARSRKTTSDYDRARRQQDLLFALKQTAQDQNVLASRGKMRELYNSFQANVNTNIGIREALLLAKMALTVRYEDLVTAVLNDDPTQRGGFLYAPAREFYRGQFVLLPSSLRDTQTFIRLTLVQPQILLENAQISILNGSPISGLAGLQASQLRRFGFHVINTGNYESDSPVFRSFLTVKSGRETPLTQKFLRHQWRLESLLENIEITKDGVLDIEIVLGVAHGN